MLKTFDRQALGEHKTRSLLAAFLAPGGRFLDVPSPCSVGVEASAPASSWGSNNSFWSAEGMYRSRRGENRAFFKSAICSCRTCSCSCSRAIVACRSVSTRRRCSFSRSRRPISSRSSPEGIDNVSFLHSSRVHPMHMSRLSPISSIRQGDF